jgi:pimeloyl-ACP methyl ester carboxylesterase
MPDQRGLRRRLLVCVCAVTGVLLSSAPGALAKRGLAWEPCGDVGSQCATAAVPRDYDHPNGSKLHIAVAKSPATGPGTRIGSLFFNFGGPGAFTAPYVEFFGPDLFPELNKRFDIVGMDPRGTAIDLDDENSADCQTNPEQESIYSMPFTTPFNVDAGALIRKDTRYIGKCIARSAPGLLRHASTADVARDLEFTRKAVGDARMTYLGFSYGTFLGATYASMFPGRMRAVVLDGPINAAQYINRPMQALKEQSGAVERALGRIFQACAADQVNCSGFGGEDPAGAFDELIESADAAPIPAPDYISDPRPVKGDDFRAAAITAVYAKQNWGVLTRALADAAKGNGSRIRQLVDENWYGRDPETGEFDPLTDRYFMLGAVEQRYRKGDVGRYLEAGEDCWSEFDHVYFNCGYTELNYGLWPIRAQDTFRGPFRVPKSAATPLVVDTTYDPATPYRGGLLLARDLGNARVLTMRGDGHTAYGSGSPDCIDPAVERYLINRVLPPAGTKCRQEVPFLAPEDALRQRSAERQVRQVRPHVRPLPKR